MLIHSYCASVNKQWIVSSSQQAATGGRFLFAHAGRNAHWIGAQRTLCFWLHTQAHVNYLFRKLLGHFLNAVAVLHFLENVFEACQCSRPRSTFWDGRLARSIPQPRGVVVCCATFTDVAANLLDVYAGTTSWDTKYHTAGNITPVEVCWNYFLGNKIPHLQCRIVSCNIAV